MSQISYRQLLKDGTVTRRNAMQIMLEDIHEQPGFNLRIEGPDLEQSVQELADYIFQGGMVPPIEVRPREEGGVWIVDGHRRKRAYELARKMGATIVMVPIEAFNGNDVDRVTRIMTSAEGRSLSPLETAEGYKRLAAYGLKPADIAQRVGKTRQHVDDLLVLSQANHDVQQMIRDGVVSASTALEAIREHGEKAGDVLHQAAEKATKAGKARVTPAMIQGRQRALPRKAWEPMVKAVDSFFDFLPRPTREAITKATEAPEEHAGQTVEVDVYVLARLLEAHGQVGLARAKQEAKSNPNTAPGGE